MYSNIDALLCIFKFSVYLLVKRLYLIFFVSDVNLKKIKRLPFSGKERHGSRQFLLSFIIVLSYQLTENEIVYSKSTRYSRLCSSCAFKSESYSKFGLHDFLCPDSKRHHANINGKLGENKKRKARQILSGLCLEQSDTVCKKSASPILAAESSIIVQHNK